MAPMFKSLFGKAGPPPAGDEAAAKSLIAEGNALEDAGQLEQACGLYRQAIQAAPRLAAAHLNLGIALAAMGDAMGAKTAYEAALAIDPDHAFANYNFARLAHANDLQLAITLVRRALQAKPDFVEAHVLLAAMLEEAGRLDVALESLDAAIALQPAFLGARANRALLLSKMARDAEAMAQAEDVLREDPGNFAMLERLATLQLRQRLVADAMRTVRASIEHHPSHLEFRSRELFLLNFDDAVTPRELFERHRDFGLRVEAQHPQRFEFAPRPAREGRRLRIGFVSSDFYAHPVSIFAIPVLERRDRGRFEVFCYSTSRRTDQVTERVRKLADHWIDAAGLDDRAFADRIHADAIDVLVDLSGHSGTPRMAVFAQRPAPVQASWLGYLQTTGLTRMDYRLTDARSSPPELMAPLHTEQLLALEASQWCYRPLLRVEPVQTLPCDAAGFLTLGCFGQASKITPQMVRCWTAILAALPTARLVVADIGTGRARELFTGLLEQHGLDMARVGFLPRMDLERYYAAYNEVDIALDTYPYGGGTTTLDALWMNVPVATAIGPWPVSRSAASLLGELGLGEWVAPGIEEYAGLVVSRARDIDGLRNLRRGLRQRLQSSPLMDEPRFTAGLEAAFDRMWAERGV